MGAHVSEGWIFVKCTCVVSLHKAPEYPFFVWIHLQGINKCNHNGLASLAATPEKCNILYSTPQYPAAVAKTKPLKKLNKVEEVTRTFVLIQNWHTPSASANCDTVKGTIISNCFL